jgi:hypothetical protein
LRILSTPNESVSVEYGADLHTLETGSGFPTISHKGKISSTEKVLIYIYILFKSLLNLTY